MIIIDKTTRLEYGDQVIMKANKYNKTHRAIIFGSAQKTSGGDTRYRCLIWNNDTNLFYGSYNLYQSDMYNMIPTDHLNEVEMSIIIKGLKSEGFCI